MIDLSSMTKEDLHTLSVQVMQEQHARECPEFLPGHRSCDQGRAPHTQHGYGTHDTHGAPIRVTWQRTEAAA